MSIENKDLPPNHALEASLPAAFDGVREAVLKFFESFVAGPLYVPDRVQGQALSDQPSYPNDFVNVLGIKDRDRVVVPCFSRPELIEQWCGLPLSFSKLDGVTTAKRVPENWWLVVNPGQEIEKELSPWELVKIAEGIEAIPEIASDISPEDQIDPITLLPLPDNEHQELKKALLDHAKKQKDLVTIYLAKEEGLSEDGETLQTIIVGLVWDNEGSHDAEELLQNIVQKSLIGDRPFKLYSNLTPTGSIKLGMLQHTTPLYVAKKESKLSKLLNPFSK